MAEGAVDDVLLTVESWDRRLEFRTEGGHVVVTAIDREGSSSSVDTFPSVLAGLAETGVQTLESGDPVEISVSASAGIEAEKVIEALRAVNQDFAPSGGKGDVLFEPQITVNGRRFFGVLFEDDSWEFVEDADEYSTIAYVQLFESASRTSGYFTQTVGRLPSGDVLELSEPDEDEGYARASRRDMSDVEAVQQWLDGSEWWVQPLIVSAYRDGVTVNVGSDFDPEWSDTLEIDHLLALTEDELRELWTLLGVEQVEG